MSMLVKTVKAWINSLDDNSIIGIGEGGLDLETSEGDYLEVGGVAEREDG